MQQCIQLDERRSAGGTAVPEATSTGEWLERLQVLAVELEAGMSALAANQLSAFEESVARQQSLCGQLGAVVPRQRASSRPDAAGMQHDELHAVSWEAGDAELAKRIHSASQTIQVLNARYTALLRHSGRSLRMFATLQGGCEGHLPRRAGAAPQGKTQRHTWSCEG